MQNAPGPKFVTGFDQPVQITHNDLLLTNLITGLQIPTSEIILTSLGDNVYAFSFSENVLGFDGATDSLPCILPNGNFEAVYDADNVRSENDLLDGNGDGIGGDDFVEPFFFLGGDVNHDRVVDLDDLGQFDFNASTGFLLTGYSNGDLNYDGIVDTTDINLFGLTFGTSLPAMPTDPNTLIVSASTGLNQITLGWQAPTWNYDGFGIFRSADGTSFDHVVDLYNDDPEITIDAEGNCSWTDTGLPDGSKYTYRVRAFTIAGGYTLTTNKTSAVTVMPAPGPAYQRLLSSDGVTLHWDDTTTNETGFEIGVFDANDVQLDTLFVGAHENTGPTSYRVTNLDDATGYTFRVQAVTDAQASAWSDVSITTLVDGQPTAPGDLIITAPADGHSLALAWSDNSSNEAGFIIEQLDENDEWLNVGEVVANAETFTVENLWSLTDYTFRVIAKSTGSQAGGGGGQSGAPDSSPSESATGLTDRGDGVVYYGAPHFGWEHAYDGVTASWSGPYDSPDRLQNSQDDIVTITLDNLPAHYGLEIGVGGDYWNVDFSTDDDPDGVVLTALGGAVTRYTGTSGMEFAIETSGAHTDDSIEIKLQGVNWDDEYPEGWAMGGVLAKILRYGVDVESKTIAVGDTEQVKITVTDKNGPASGVTLRVDNYDGNYIEPKSETVTTDSNGIAYVEVEGIAEGSSNLVLAAENGGKGAAAQQVEQVKISGADDIWWFGGEDAQNYNEYTPLSLDTRVIPGQIKWEVTSGQGAVELDNGGGVKGDTIEAQGNDFTVVMNATGGSTNEQDVIVKVSFDGKEVATRKFTVKQPATMSVLKHEDKPAGAGFITTYTMKVVDQFDKVLPRDVEVNETLGEWQSDFANEDWVHANPNGELQDPANIRDGYQSPGGGTPAPLNPLLAGQQDAGQSVKVDHAEQAYYVGSTTPGKGVVLMRHKLQFHRGYARQA